MESREQAIIVVAGLFSVTIMEVYALSQGIDGTLLAGAVGAICTIIGYAFGVRQSGE